jgi:hypothetical protein
LGRGDWGRIRAEIAWERIGEKEKMIVAVGCEKCFVCRSRREEPEGGEKKASYES